MVAESWVLVTLPSIAIFGPAVGGIVGGVHFLLGYGVLARRPQDTGAI